MEYVRYIKISAFSQEKNNRPRGDFHTALWFLCAPAFFLKESGLWTPTPSFFRTFLVQVLTDRRKKVLRKLVFYPGYTTEANILLGRIPKEFSS